MAQVIWDNTPETLGTMTPNGHVERDEGAPLPFEQPQKLKGRRRILQSLQRISSTPSLCRLGRNSSTTYVAGGKASMSCVSLASSSSRHGHSYGQSNLSIQSSAGFSTTPTSMVTTPAWDTPHSDLNNRLRHLDVEISANAPAPPRSVPLPADVRPWSKDAPNGTPLTPEVFEDYFSKPTARVKDVKKRRDFNFWRELPPEISMHILHFLRPKELVKASLVSREWHKMCFDGQLWRSVVADEYYRDITANSLIAILKRAGPFIRDLNLRGCIQMADRWNSDGREIMERCQNLEYFSLEGCRIDRNSVHHFLNGKPRLVHINLSGLKDVNNLALKIISRGSPQLEYLNVSWCPNVDSRGLVRIIKGCTLLKDLRMGEIKGLNDEEFLLALFEQNSLERLIASRCLDLDDDSLRLLVQGDDPEIDPLTERAVVPPRKFRHLDLSGCKGVTDTGLQYLAYNVPDLEGFQICKCDGITDEALAGILASVPRLTHLDLDELELLSNTTLFNIAASPCAQSLKHLNISYCETLGDRGMLQVLKACPKLQKIEMDNTRVSDLVLTEAAALTWARERSRCSTQQALPRVVLHLVVFDCQNVTWTGIREILSRNTEANRREVVSLKCFYGYQDTVNEHMKRVLRGDVGAAAVLEKKWAQYMIASEDAGPAGAGARRRRRRLREAASVHADEEEGGPRNGRRRARSGGCAIM